MREVWKPILEGSYSVSSYGQVKSLLPRSKCYKKLRKVIIDEKGYFTIGLRCHGQTKKFRIHQLVALAFLGSYPKGCEVNHKDGDKKNNHYSNLEFITHRKNIEHAMKMKLRDYNSISGENNKNAKLNWKKVSIIRKSKIPSSVLAKQFGVSKTVVLAVRKNKIWKGR